MRKIASSLTLIPRRLRGRTRFNRVCTSLGRSRPELVRAPETEARATCPCMAKDTYVPTQKKSLTRLNPWSFKRLLSRVRVECLAVVDSENVPRKIPGNIKYNIRRPIHPGEPYIPSLRFGVRQVSIGGEEVHFKVHIRSSCQRRWRLARISFKSISCPAIYTTY